MDLNNNSNTLETLDCVSRQQNLQPTCNQLATDTISRQAAIERIRGTGYADQIKENVIMILMSLPSAKPKRETTTLKIGRSRNSVTMWYECDACGEPVDKEDAFCRRCGREIIHE